MPTTPNDVAVVDLPSRGPIPLFKVFMSPEVDKPLLKTLHSGYIAQGPVVDAFESSLRQFLGVETLVTLNSATSALHLALHLLKKADGPWPGLGPDDEVLSSPLTCTATNWPVVHHGLKLKWVDVDPRTCNMSLDDLQAKLSEKTKIILFVHWGGTPIDLDAVRALQDACLARHGFRPVVIEDCSHALGAEYRGRLLGAHGNICVFSFQAIKHVTCGDGGLLVLPNRVLYERARLLRWYGIDREARNYGGRDFRLEGDVPEAGFKYHLNDIAAAIGAANLAGAALRLHAHRENARFYDTALQGLAGISLVHPPPGAVSAYWVYSLHVTDKPQFLDWMAARGVAVSQVHRRNDTHSCVASARAKLPALDGVERTLVCLPVGWWVTPEDRDHIVRAVRAWSAAVPDRSLPGAGPGTAVTLPGRRSKVIVTGGCGFIGHHVVEHLVKNTDHDVVVIDKLSYASAGYERLRDTEVMDRVKVFSFDLCQPLSEGLIYEIGGDVAFVVHMAAETHVDNSIADPVRFIRNNIDSTLSMLEYARTLPGLRAFFYFSTDEVFGPAPGTTAYGEWDRHRPTNPYSSSKSGAENICLAYENTYKLPVIIVNVMNAFGERQHPEKFIPKTIRMLLLGETVQIHAYEDGRAGSRFYIHARNIAAAVLFLLEKGQVGEKYNVVGEREVDNLQMAQFIASVMGRELRYVLNGADAARPGHDLRYGLCGDKMAAMGWKLPLSFEDSLRKTILWTLENERWIFGDGLSLKYQPVVTPTRDDRERARL